MKIKQVSLEYYEKALIIRINKLGFTNHSSTHAVQSSVKIMKLLIEYGIDEELLMELVNHES